ncbi:endothelin-converting enzyme homolog [Periplaneta americana]|uniref:endothelin-converting enzyme homolog n=1 Tax=Periplaneta americana TaxID=6978 RepID=UPI0037E85127
MGDNFRSVSQQSLVSKSLQNPRGKRTRLENRLIVWVSALAVFCFIFLIIFIIQTVNNRKMTKEKKMLPCTTKRCIESAFTLLESMDRSVDPCKDFYQFACGNFPKNHPVSESDVYNDWDNEIDNSLSRKLKGLLEENSSSSEPMATRQAKIFYKACMDLDELEKLGLEPIMQVLDNTSLPRIPRTPGDDTIGGWDIATTLARIKRVLDLDVLLKLELDYSENNTYFKISPSTATPKLQTSWITEQEKVLELHNLNRDKRFVTYAETYMKETLRLMDSWGKAEDDVTKLDDYKLEDIISGITMFESNVREPFDMDDSTESRNVTLESLSYLLDEATYGSHHEKVINWVKFFDVLTAGIDDPVAKSDDLIIVTDLGYLKQLTQLLVNIRFEVTQAYIWWQVVQALAPHSSRAMRDIRSETLRNMFSIPMYNEHRWQTCLKYTRKMLRDAVSATMAARYDISDAVSKVSDMMVDVKEGFISLVRESDWLDDDTKKAVVDKAEDIATYCGYQDFVLNISQSDDYYASFDLQEKQHLLNILRIISYDMEFFLENGYDEFWDWRNSSWMYRDPLKVDATYFTEDNLIIINAGFIQFPNYGHDLQALNYGAIGTVLGHEMTHAFDNDGKRYWINGSKVSWWKEEAYREEEEREKCLVWQYSKFRLGNRPVNGTLTLGENMADNGGLRQAYRAYQNYKERHGPEPDLPGLEDFTHDQLFFLAYAHLWCVAEGTRYEDVLRDEHSPHKFRLRGSVSNFEEFSKAFKCSKNSPMSPCNRCVIW